MNARDAKTPEDVLFGWIQGSNERVAQINAQKAISDLYEAGFVILPRSEVEAIRDNALEEAAAIVDCNCRKKKRPCDEYDCPREQADEIRKLKSGGE